MAELDWIDLLLIPAIKVLVLFLSLLLVVPLLVAAERKIIGRIQQRPGPNRVLRPNVWGLRWFGGWLQGLVDGIKLALKEDFVPPGADLIPFVLAPALTVIPAFLAITIVPVAPPITLEIFGKAHTISFVVSDLPVGILLYFAVTSLGVYGIVLAGWASNNKYSLMGGIRSSAQLLSYELALGLSLIGAILIVGTFRMVGEGSFDAAQSGGVWTWLVWRQPLGAMLFLIAGFAETNRLPFDLPEGESELGAGFHTEYSSLKFALFFLAEYVNVFTFSAILTAIFLGGYHGPIAMNLPPALAIVSGVCWFTLKIALLFFFFVWVRGTLPRLRYDQLMDLGWKAMFPLALANVVVTAGVVVLGLPVLLEGLALLAVGIVMILATDRFSIALRKRALENA